ncbi:hypothetical protein GCM10010398_63540 [Streptomyces fimbriatus]
MKDRKGGWCARYDVIAAVVGLEHHIPAGCENRFREATDGGDGAPRPEASAAEAESASSARVRGLAPRRTR